MINLKVRGDYAFFNIPGEQSSDSCNVMTPLVARAILESFYYKPAMCYIIDQIKVLNPIKHDEIYVESLKQQITVLKDVAYIISAHIELTHKKSNREDSNPKISPLTKHYSIFDRRVSRKIPHTEPYLGHVGFPMSYELLKRNSLYRKENRPALKSTIVCRIPCDMDYNLYKPIYYSLMMQEGTIKIPYINNMRG